jgi:hypothetical protein
MNIRDIADALDSAPRQGAAVDDPEGSRHVVFSDTALQKLTRELRLAAAERFESEDLGSRMPLGRARRRR